MRQQDEEANWLNPIKKLRSWCPQPKTSAPISLTRIAQLWKRFKFLYAIPVAFLIAMIAGVLIFLSTYIGPGQAKIEVKTDKQSYQPGEEIQFRIYIRNPQMWQICYPNTMTYEIFDQNGTRIEPWNTHSQGGGPLPIFSETLYYTYTWEQGTGFLSNRTQVPCGNYTFCATLGGIQLAPVLMNQARSTNNDSYELFDYENGGNCTIEIKPAP